MAAPRDCEREARAILRGGPGGICTPEGVSHLIYSQARLTTSVPTHECNDDLKDESNFEGGTPEGVSHLIYSGLAFSYFGTDPCFKFITR